MSNMGGNADWRAARRRSAAEAIVKAAWELVDSEGLAALSLRELAKRVGITTPTVYAYFESKNAIYDAMFERAATEFCEHMSQPYPTLPPGELLLAGADRFLAFCTSNVSRYQLLFQRSIPGFEPSALAFAPAVRALEIPRAHLRANGITESRHLDLWTALTTGLVDQQIANQPGGDRWTSLLGEAVTMFLAHVRPVATAPSTSSHRPRSTTKGARP